MCTPALLAATLVLGRVAMGLVYVYPSLVVLPISGCSVSEWSFTFGLSCLLAQTQLRLFSMVLTSSHTNTALGSRGGFLLLIMLLLIMNAFGVLFR